MVNDDDKVYHVSPNEKNTANNFDWKVKCTGNEKANKLFATQQEAIEYAKERAKNQDGRVVIHRPDGKIREAINYGKIAEKERAAKEKAQAKAKADKEKALAKEKADKEKAKAKADKEKAKTDKAKTKK